MIRSLVSLLLVALFLPLFCAALVLHTVDQTVLDRAFARSAVPTLLSSAGDIVALGISAQVKWDHDALVETARLRAAFREAVTDGTVEALVDDLYRQIERIAETGNARLDLPLEPLAVALQAFHDRIMRELVRPALPKELPADALAKLDRSLAGELPERIALDIGQLEATPLTALRFHMRNRSLVDALAFACALLPLLLLFPLHAGRAAAALRWGGTALLAAAALVAFVRFSLHLLFLFPEMRAWEARFGLNGIFAPFQTAVALFMAPASRVGLGCLFLGLFAFVVAAHPAGDAEIGDQAGEGAR